MIFKRVIFYSILMLLTGCYSGSMLQTAKPVDKGRANFTGGFSYYVFDYFPVDNELPPAFTGMLRFGLSDRMDFGLKYSTGLWGHFKTDFKYAIIQNEERGYYFSTGLGLDLVSNADDERTRPGIEIPLYFSFRHHEKYVPYFCHKFSLGLTDLNTVWNYNSFGIDELGNSNYSNFQNLSYWTIGGGMMWGYNENRKWYLELCFTTHIEHYIRAWNYDATNNGIEKNRYFSFHPELSIGISLGNH